MTKCRPKRVYTKLRARAPELKAGLIRSPIDAARAATDLIGDNAHETFLVTYQNAQNCIFAYEEFTEGNMTGVSVHPAAIFRAALLEGAVSIITYHQHPSGSLDPSMQDQALWSRIRAMGELMGIAVLDNFILTPAGFFSEEEGYPKEW